MNERRSAESSRRAADAPAEELWCPRLQRPLPVEEHARCSYCFGSVTEIRSGKHARFCDFDPARDPIHFGFPDSGGWVRE